MQMILRCVAVVVLEHSSEAFVALDLTIRKSDFITWFDDLVIDALMIAFGVVVLGILGDHMSQPLLAEDDHVVQALGLDGSYEPLGE